LSRFGRSSRIPLNAIPLSERLAEAARRGIPIKEQIQAKVLAKASTRPTYRKWYDTTIPSYYLVPHHIDWLCEEVVQEIIEGRLQRVILSMPPQHAKSDTITRRLPVYWGEHFPGENALLTGYNQRFAEKQLSKPARDLAHERGILSSDATALDEWSFTTGGTVSVRGVGTPPTGIPRLRLIIIDDPIKSWEEASSETIRENIWEWYTGAIVQRFWPDTIVVIIATRWHEDDLIGRLTAQPDHGWTVINFPALAVEGDVLGREVGEPLWPEQKPKKFILQQLKDAGAHKFEALFQGNPTPPEGSLFHPDKIEIVEAIPAGLKSCLAWDLGATEDDGDWTAGVELFGPDSDGIFYADVVRFQHEPNKRNRRIRQEADLRKPSRIRGPQDPGAAGKESAQKFLALHAGYSVVVLPVSGDKELRAEPSAAQVNAGNLKLLNSKYAKDFIEELRAFPRGRNDDWVDALADAMAERTAPTRKKIGVY